MYGIFGEPPDRRVEKIIARLLKLTRDRELEWRVNGEVITTRFDALTARIAPGLITPILYIYDSSGKQLTTYGGGQYYGESGLVSVFGAKASSTANPVSELYETARRIALGIDEKLDVIDQALDRTEKPAT